MNRKRYFSLRSLSRSNAAAVYLDQELARNYCNVVSSMRCSREPSYHGIDQA
jgi:hypothetical protein